MKFSTRRAIPLIFAAAAIAMASGCSDDEPGTPIPAGDQTSSPQASASATPSAAAADIDAVEPCSLLTDDELAQFGEFKAPDEKEVGTARTCTYLAERTSASNEQASVGFAVRDNVGVADLTDHGYGVQEGQTVTTGREATQAKTDDGCTVALAVGEGARVDTVVLGMDPNKACATANKIAEIVDPKLPKA